MSRRAGTPRAGASRAAAWLGLRAYEVELLRPARPTPPLSWLLLGAGVAALLLAAVLLAPAWRQHEEITRQRAGLEAALERLGVALPGAGVRARRDGPDEARELVVEINRPWHELFEQLEAAAASDKGAVHLVQLTVEPRFSSLQIVAESRDLDGLVRFAQRLSGGAPIHAMSLTHYEWRDAPGARVINATLQGEIAVAPPAPAPGVAAAPAARRVASAAQGIVSR